MAKQQPMLTKPAGSAAVGVRETEYLSEDSALDQDADPDAIVQRILGMLSRDRFRQARDLAQEAVTRFPENPRICRAWSLFDPRNKAKPSNMGTQPSTDEEFGWLKDPPEWARGKWVALIGSEAVASADTLDELMELVGSRKDSTAPLAVRIDAA